ncbi:galactosyltransferase-related protein [Snuella lapsa]|uniref:Galactosyltransferase-related protein n=1 Tax=Snuella lapsa TaxID=870481 RepID=A0ABP6XRQ5_9FLAO
MNKFPYDLKNTSFLIYVRIDSEDRLVNLELVVKHITKYFNTTINLLEVDSSPKISTSFIKKHGIEYEFFEDDNEVFYTTKYRNYLIRKCKAPYFFICDTDVIAAPEALLQSIAYLTNISNNNVLVYPYNGDCYNVSKQYRDEYALTNDYDFLKENEKEHMLWFKYSTGGVFGGKTKTFLKDGIDNENIYGWGPDDKERYYRLKRKGFTIKRMEYTLYHLYHQRNNNSRPYDEKLKNRNQIEYLKLFSSNF